MQEAVLKSPRRNSEKEQQNHTHTHTQKGLFFVNAEILTQKKDKLNYNILIYVFQ